ncbi:MAG TPA: redoxin domain-containing protein [bacterium]|nr:redoxin domain-containing protein [bacterium]
MKKIKCLALAALVAGWGTFAQAAAVGKAAPDFQAVDTQGKAVSLKALKGHYVVLEWHNQDCPFVKSQYKGKMQKLQGKWTARGVTWISVISSAPGKEGSVDAAKANADVKETSSQVSATVLDPTGKIGRAYGAKSTPHMFVIDPKGTLIYDGAIDNDPLDDAVSDKTQDGGAYVNYVDQALTQSLAGEKVSTPTTAPYGCGVKYAH